MADLVIRGMEMPTEQRIEVLIFKNGFVAYYDVEGRYIGQAKAVPLPEGHGRLGDLDKLIINIGDVPYKGSVRRVLMSAPTIVPAEGGVEE